MNLEFKLYEINEENEVWRKIKRIEPNIKNDFIVIGEKENFYKAHHLGKKGPLLVNGLNIDETAFFIDKSEMNIQGNDIYTESIELDIPKEFLNVDIIENIIRLNEI